MSGCGMCRWWHVSGTPRLGSCSTRSYAGSRRDLLKISRIIVDTRLLEILACPICKGTLKFQRDAQVLVCRMDRLAYPIRDDVPVMLEEEARQLSADDPLLER